MGASDGLRHIHLAVADLHRRRVLLRHEHVEGACGARPARDLVMAGDAPG